MPRSLPPLTALRAFEAAARLSSFTSAARELHVTPAAVSHQIRGLEKYLGVTLFRRTTRRLLLTEQGQLAAEHFREGFERLDRGVRLTPGQGKGGVIAGIEERAAGYPIVGDVINKARRQSIEDFNRVIYKKALEPFGKEGAAVAGKTKVGNEGIQAVGDFLSDKYDDALARSVPAQVDKPFRAAINKLHAMVPKALKDDFATIINSNVEVTPAGTAHVVVPAFISFLNFAFSSLISEMLFATAPSCCSVSPIFISTSIIICSALCAILFAYLCRYFLKK
jgi:hypothetical protein